ncbi:uncharacterized protein LOC127751043 [Frankliniella occidentalis]|uniref:Uncharacterized protein LOC127751043 n=1 Tax=Frankliniella occidentalis TaxID=133901 RepID=A0A9C6XSS0_FRAOC|nr:uncharacterized protein LOC127751043 [Frankliniella occidentalis]
MISQERPDVPTIFGQTTREMGYFFPFFDVANNDAALENAIKNLITWTPPSLFPSEETRKILKIQRNLSAEGIPDTLQKYYFETDDSDCSKECRMAKVKTTQYIFSYIEIILEAAFSIVSRGKLDPSTNTLESRNDFSECCCLTVRSYPENNVSRRFKVFKMTSFTTTECFVQILSITLLMHCKKLAKNYSLQCKEFSSVVKCFALRTKSFALQTNSLHLSKKIVWNEKKIVCNAKKIVGNGKKIVCNANFLTMLENSSEEFCSVG